MSTSETEIPQMTTAASVGSKASKKTEKKTTTAKQSKSKSNHPPTSEMVNTAIKGLKEKSGSSLQAIKKYIGSNYKVDSEKLAPFIRKYLKSAVQSGSLVQTKGKGASGSFKLAASASAQGTQKKVTSKKVVKSGDVSVKNSNVTAVDKKKKKTPAAKTNSTASRTKKAATAIEKKITKVTKSPSKAKKTVKSPTKKPKAPKPKTVKSVAAAKKTAPSKKKK